MKILHVSYYFLPWLGYDAELARVQQESGHHVLYAASNHVPETKRGSENVEPTGPEPVEHSLLWPLTIGSRIVLLPGMLRVLFGFRPDVVHCHMFIDLTSVLVALCKPLLRYRVVYCCHSSYLNTNATSSWRRRIAYWLFRQTGSRMMVAAADHIVAVAENERIMAARELSLAPEQVELVRLGAPVESYRVETAQREAARAHLGFDQHHVVLLHVGSQEPAKALHDLLDAVSSVHRTHEEIRVLIVGGGDEAYIEALRERATRLEIEDCTTILGYFVPKDELRQYYAAADIGVWPGVYSIATLEAMASGLPLIVPDDDPYTEFLISDNNGYRFTQGDIDALAGRIVDLATDGPKRFAMGEASRRLAESEFDWSRIARRFLDLYQRDAHAPGASVAPPAG